MPWAGCMGVLFLNPKDTMTTSHFHSQFIIPWEQAFNKFGFDDGRYSLTDNVAETLECYGYQVEVSQGHIHNDTITSIRKNDHEIMPLDASDHIIGYDDPREYLDRDIICFLDKLFYGSTSGTQQKSSDT